MSLAFEIKCTSLKEKQPAMTPPKDDPGLQPDAVPAEVLNALGRLVRETRFGSIEIVIHEGRVTQIERREKLRFSQLA
jgi:hypothetical protein